MLPRNRSLIQRIEITTGIGWLVGQISRHAQMTIRSKVLPLTVHCLSPLPG